MTANHRPLIAIVGAGLAGGLLAEELGKWARVTVFERGGSEPTRPDHPIIERHPLGLYPSYGYGLGGTTNIWHGGLLAMRPEEYGGHWPDEVPEDLEQYQSNVVRRLYGEEWLRTWNARGAANEHSPPFLDMMIKPRETFRVRESRCFSRVDLRLGHHVERVEEVGDKILLYVEGSGSGEPLVFDLVVISAGGMNSPIILQRSNIGGQNVGENITDHPMGFVAKVTRGPDHSRFDCLRRLPDAEPMLKIYDAKSALWSAFYLRPTESADIVSDPYADSFKTLGSFGGLRKYFSALSKLGNMEFRTQAIEHLLGRPYLGLHAYILVVSEQEARGQGSVREDVSGAIRVNWVVSDAVISAIDRSLDKLADWLGGELHRVPGDMRNRLWSAAHHSGGCQIANDPKMGVVDSDLRVHGTERIFVCDSSVLPSTGASNTGLTIGALALRLAAHLALRSAQAPRLATPHTLPSVLISGATGHVGKMVEPALTRAGVPTMTLDVRINRQVVEVEKASILVHLANTSGSWRENLKLQQMIADVVNTAGITNVIVPMSFATLEVPTQDAGDPETFNLGFTSTARSNYIVGKLKSEEFWLEWQKELPGRCLQLLYIPTILGPNSAWTQNVARHCPEMTIWVPRIPQFFTLDEGQLGKAILDLCRAPSFPGINRHLAVSHCGSLAEAIVADRGETVREVKVPGPVWLLFSLSKRKRMVGAVLWLNVKLVDWAFRLAAKRAVLPIRPSYCALFSDQSHFNRKTVGLNIDEES